MGGGWFVFLGCASGAGISSGVHGCGCTSPVTRARRLGAGAGPATLACSPSVYLSPLSLCPLPPPTALPPSGRIRQLWRRLDEMYIKPIVGGRSRAGWGSTMRGGASRGAHYTAQVNEDDEAGSGPMEEAQVVGESSLGSSVSTPDGDRETNGIGRELLDKRDSGSTGHRSAAWGRGGGGERRASVELRTLSTRGEEVHVHNGVGAGAQAGWSGGGGVDALGEC